MGGISMFNFRSYDDWDVSYTDILVKNKAQFGVTVDYILSNSQVYTAFGPDISRSYASDLITCLRNIKVLIYNGQNDVVVNTAGVMQYINSLNWEGLNRWKWTRKEIWTRYGEVKGWAKVAGNLWFVLTNGAGHLVPIDQPEAAFSMIGHFVHNDHDWKQ
jgi:carboxypeptidase C (cathepsin A)